MSDPEGTLAVSDALGERWADEPAYDTFEFRSYLGTTISVDGELYGTLCFGDTAALEEPIRDKERTLIEMHGQEYRTRWSSGIGCRLGQHVSTRSKDALCLRTPSIR
ncbi:GAF domain-containing protein [Natronomonas salsuginis]|uniref:GAF domain-containing protein n=1 Tax=Natronomonas salsuginis TaxID=2217661 RepID=UPI00374229E6